VLALGGRMKGPDVEHGIAARVRDALIRKRRETDDDQEKTENGSRFHVSLSRTVMRSGEIRMFSNAQTLVARPQLGEVALSRFPNGLSL
jgi:hypothetical protein